MAEFKQGYAVVVGVGQDLPATITDATDVYDVLVNQAHCGYPPSQVKLLIGPQATKGAVLKALEWLAAHARSSEATAIFYFSGHGTDAGAGFHLLPHGYDYPDGLVDTAISYDELLACTRAVEAGKFVMLLDCCYAGGQGQAKTKAPGAPVIKSANMPSEAAKLLAQGVGRVFVASSTASQPSLIYHGMTNSVFTHYLVAGLKDQAGVSPDAFVHVLDLWRSVSDGVKTHTGKAQAPELHTSGLQDARGFPLAWHSGGKKKEPPSPPPPSPPPRNGPRRPADQIRADIESLESLLFRLRAQLDHLDAGSAKARLENDIIARETSLAKLHKELEEAI